jgi:hypothetical protein
VKILPLEDLAEEEALVPAIAAAVAAYHVRYYW